MSHRQGEPRSTPPAGRGSGARHLLRASRCFDAVGDAVVAPGSVLIEGDRIAAVGPEAERIATPDTQVTELGDRTLLPGLIDAHVHFTGTSEFAERWSDPPLGALRAAAQARAVLESGVTTARDCGGAFGIPLRKVIDAGELPGPRVFAAGPMISQSGGHADRPDLPRELHSWLEDERLIADGVDACRTAVRRAVGLGADLIKICTTGGVGSEGDHPLDEHFSPEEIDQLVGEAHRAGRRVAAHAQGARGVMNAVRAGVDSIEHGYFVDEACVEAMLERGTFLVPTFGLIEFFTRSCDGNPYGLSSDHLRKQEQCIAAMESSFPLAHRSGVPMAAGSDAYGPPGRELGRTADEPIAMVAYGMRPGDALKAATVGGARVIGVEAELGTVEPGKLADLIAVDGDPLDAVTSLRDVAFVMKGGAVVRAISARPARPR